MALRIFAEIESAPGVVVGDGPITDMTQVRSNNRLNQAGSWSMTLPATCRQADQLTAQRTVMIYALIGGVKTFLGGGAIDRKRTRLDNDGKLYLELAGVGLLGEWSREALETLVLDDTGDQNITDVLLMKPTGWAAGKLGTSADFKRVFQNETLLGALVAIAKQMGHVFTLRTVTGEARTLQYYVDLLPTVWLRCVLNVHALEAEDNPLLATIVSIEEASTSYDICNRAYVYGAGTGENALTMAAATVWPDDTTALSSSYIAPSGDEYFYNAATNRITNADSYARLDDSLRSKRLQFPDIGLVENSDQGLEDAANLLVKAAVAHLERHRSPQTIYKFKLAELRTRIYPGDLIHIDARRWIDGEKPIDINTDVYVLSVTDNLDNNGVWTADVEASDVPAWPEDPVTQVVQDAQVAKVQTAHVQLTGNIDTIGHQELIVGGGSARIWVFLADEVTLINRVVLRYLTARAEVPIANDGAPLTEMLTGASAALEHGHAASGGDPMQSVSVGITGSTGAIDSGAAGAAHTHNANHTHSGHAHGLDDHAAHIHPIAWGHTLQDFALTYGVSDLEFNINGEDSGATWRTGSHLTGTGWQEWYALDITDLVRNATTRRPEFEGASIDNFYIDVQAKTASLDPAFSCLFTAQVQVGTAIQQTATF